MLPLTNHTKNTSISLLFLKRTRCKEQRSEGRERKNLSVVLPISEALVLFSLGLNWIHSIVGVPSWMFQQSGASCKTQLTRVVLVSAFSRLLSVIFANSRYELSVVIRRRFRCSVFFYYFRFVWWATWSEIDWSTWFYLQYKSCMLLDSGVLLRLLCPVALVSCQQFSKLYLRWVGVFFIALRFVTIVSSFFLDFKMDERFYFRVGVYFCPNLNDTAEFW